MEQQACPHGWILLTKSKAIPVSMKRLAERSYEDIENIKNDLETHGVALVKDVMTSKQMKDIYAQFCQDVSKIYDISASERVFDNPDFVFGRQNKGGGAWGPISRDQGGVGREVIAETPGDIQKIIGRRFRPVRRHRFFT